MRNFGQCFRDFLREKNLTQTQAAELLKWSQRNVSYYCSIDTPPRPHILKHMAESFGVSVEELLGEDDGGEKPLDEISQLRRQIAELKAENASLKKQLAAFKKLAQSTTI